MRVRLGVNVLGVGCHPAAWRTGEVEPTAQFDVAYFQQVARIGERGTLDAVFLADQPGLFEPPDRRPPMTALEPTVVLAAVASATERIGVVATASTSYNEPFNLARRIASLDHLSGGRAGWNAVTTYAPTASANFGFEAPASHDERYGRADEFLSVTKQLWDSWADDALVGDVDAGVYADTGRIEPIDHVGEHFSVRGPLNVPRSRQGRPVLVQAGGSPQGRALAAKHAEAIFTSQLTLEAGQAFYADIKSRVLREGRDPDGVLILPGLTTVIGGTEAEAHARYERLEELAGGSGSLWHLAAQLGLDAESLDLDAPLPPIDRSRLKSSVGFQDAFLSLAAQGLTVRQIVTRFASGHRLVVGAPEQVADTIEAWVRERAADGFNLMPDVFPTGLEAFVDHVVPELRRRGIFRTEYEGTTLREHLGLPRPVRHEAVFV
ncbi:LLM class flavin-dependent oxidoreductase [Solirubrobacter phytolaccae]|uniref:LLM class flavin-dependent oxidoreductase n=1 Tax=Solirubrobacter phytolaccae TaxID=1404360 RepID=A0A9X3NKG0_9ACTN|nr:LLM class flavin-dependent oxidoreductase [Solirubrobacter phytolaccae]MDA0183042.1 LLM class flavin-dependent oxidoreductase [Solirubrobacter phytolaccae]